MANKKNSPKSPAATLSDSRVENVLAYMAAAVIGVSILSLLSMLILPAFGVKDVALVVKVLPGIGFPIGFLLVFALLIINIVRKSRENRKTNPKN
jgi:hypothetical protein